MKKFAIYTRSNNGNDEHNDQLAECKSYVHDLGGEVTCIYKDTASGNSQSIRKGYQKLLESIAQQEVDAIIAVDFSRFSRQLKAMHYLVCLCEIHGVAIFTADSGEIGLKNDQIAGGVHA